MTDKKNNILEFPFNMLNELKTILSKKEVQSMSDGADKLDLTENHDKLLELLEKCHLE